MSKSFFKRYKFTFILTKLIDFITNAKFLPKILLCRCCQPFESLINFSKIRLE